MRITDESHEFILDEIRRRERLECDPSRVLVTADEDSEDESFLSTCMQNMFVFKGLLLLSFFVAQL